jgi:hypothetical protein
MNMTSNNETAMREAFDQWFDDYPPSKEFWDDKDLGNAFDGGYQAATAHHAAELARYKAAMVEARDGLLAGQMCAQVIALGGGAAGNEVMEEEMPAIRSALAHLNTLLNEGA